MQNVIVEGQGLFYNTAEDKKYIRSTEVDENQIINENDDETTKDRKLQGIMRRPTALLG